MIENLSVREAEEKDIDFIIEAIIAAEKSGSEVVTSCNLFALDEKQFTDVLRNVLSQNMPGYDYFLSGFLIAEKNGEYIGALGSWIESAGGVPSGIIKASCLFPYLEKEKMKLISKNSSVIKGLTIAREEGTLQLEHGYTREKYRRHGVFTELIKQNIKRNISVNKDISKVQGILFKENYKSFQAHLKFGYKVVEEKKVDDPEIFKFFPYNSKVMMEFGGERLANL